MIPSREDTDKLLEEALGTDEVLLAVSSDRAPYGVKENKLSKVTTLVEEYAAKLDYLIAMKALVEKNIPLDFYE